MRDKKEKLRQWMTEHTRSDVAVAFSGGVDSSLLLWIACEAAKEQGTRVYAFTIQTALHPVEEADIAKHMAEEMGAIHRSIFIDVFREAGIENNPVNRCYLCKKCMFTKLIAEASKLGIGCVIDGSNADDSKVYRPGMQALLELKVHSPLLSLGVTKAEVRQMAAEYGMAVSEKPSTPCLATRFPYDTPLAEEEMKKVDRLEGRLREMGFCNVRCRVHGSLLRIEVDEEALCKLLTSRKDLLEEAKKLGYTYVTMDLQGFLSGSQDKAIAKHQY